MNKKFALYAFSLALLAPFLTGCMCTNAVGRHIGFPYYENFEPSVVYRRENPVGFALEGTRETKGESVRAFVIVQDYFLGRVDALTNQALSVEDIQKAYYNFALRPDETRPKLPQGYVRVAVLPKNDLAIMVGPCYPVSGWNFLMPFAFIADLATFPFQLIYCCAGGDIGWGC